MAWIVFWVVIVLFVLVLSLAIHSMFLAPDRVDTWVKLGLLGVDGILAASMKKMVDYLFFPPK